MDGQVATTCVVGEVHGGLGPAVYLVAVLFPPGGPIVATIMQRQPLRVCGVEEVDMFEFHSNTCCAKHSSVGLSPFGHSLATT